mgnify:FL=1
MVKIEVSSILQISYIKKRRNIRKKRNLIAKKSKNTYRQQKWDHVSANLKNENWNKLENNKNEENDTYKTHEHIKIKIESLIGWEKGYWSNFNGSLHSLVYL